MSLASLRTPGQFVLLVAKRFEQDRCQRVAGALSFTTVLAIVPLTAVMLAVLSLAPGFSSWMNVIQDFIYSNFVPAAGDVVQKYLTQFASKAGRLTVLGLLFLTITTILLMATIEQAFNDIWRVANSRRLLRRFLAYLALLTLGPILVVGSLTLTSKVFTLAFLGRAEVTMLHDVLGVMLPLVFEFGAVVLLYTVVPNVSVAWRYALAGGVVCGGVAGGRQGSVCRRHEIFYDLPDTLRRHCGAADFSRLGLHLLGDCSARRHRHRHAQ